MELQVRTIVKWAMEHRNDTDDEIQSIARAILEARIVEAE